MLTIKFTKCHPSAVLPSRATTKSFGYDLTSVEDVFVEHGRTAFIPTGLKLAQELPLVQVPSIKMIDGQPAVDITGGCGLLIFPRSSTFLKHGLLVANSPGLVDADYTGEIKIIVYNPGNLGVSIPAGTRIAQAVFAYLDMPLIAETEFEDRAERGGFGSTGV